MSQNNPAGDDNKILFKKKCASCHGEDGKKCLLKASDLSKSKIHDTSSIRIITDGKNKMPAFSKKLTREEILLLNDYIKTLRTF